MSFIEIIILGAAVALAASAVTVFRGAACAEVKARDMLCAGAWFTVLQCLMTAAGYLAGRPLTGCTEAAAAGTASAALAVAAAVMLARAFIPWKEKAGAGNFRPAEMLPTSLIAGLSGIAAGAAASVMQADFAELMIAVAVETAIFSSAGAAAGKFMGEKLKARAQIFGAAFLIITGLRILLTYLGIIA